MKGGSIEPPNLVGEGADVTIELGFNEGGSIEPPNSKKDQKKCHLELRFNEGGFD